MRHRIQTRRQSKTEIPSQVAQPAKGHLQPRPFATEEASSGGMEAIASPTQAQQEQVARPTPSLLDIPLYPPAFGTGGAATASPIQMQPDEANLKPPQGTLQRQQVDEQTRDDQINQMPQTSAPMSEDDDRVQRQATVTQDEEETAKAIQAKEDDQVDELQEKAEAEETEAEADEEIQRKEAEKEELEAKLDDKRSQTKK